MPYLKNRTNRIQGTAVNSSGTIVSIVNPIITIGKDGDGFALPENDIQTTGPNWYLDLTEEECRNCETVDWNFLSDNSVTDVGKIVLEDSDQSQLYVEPSTKGGSSANDGSHPLRAKALFTEALAIAEDGDTINIAKGTITDNGEHDITVDLTVQGSGRSSTVLKSVTGAGANSILAVNGKSLTLKDLTLEVDLTPSITNRGHCLKTQGNAFTNVEAYNCTFKGGDDVMSIGVSGTGYAKLYFEKCIIDCTWDGIALTNPKGIDLTLKDCIFIANSATITNFIKMLVASNYEEGNINLDNCTFIAFNAGEGTAVIEWSNSSTGVVRFNSKDCTVFSDSQEIKHFKDLPGSSTGLATISDNANSNWDDTKMDLSENLKYEIRSMSPDDVIPVSGNVNNSIADCLNAARAQGFGKWVVDSANDQLLIYGPDNTTVVKTFDLAPVTTSATSRTPQ